MTAPQSTAMLNDGQRAALDLHRDLIVSAGAGAGKTQVLGLRYLAILEEGLATVPEIVAFTFTEKASAEMRDRVQKLLLARIEELPRGERLQRLQRAQGEFARNRISTVHGFCHRLLRDFAWEAGLEPRAPILEPRAQALARENAIRRVLLRTNANEEPELAAALVRLGSVVRLNSLIGTVGTMLADRAFVRPPLRNAAEAWRDPDAEIARRKATWDALITKELAEALGAADKIDYAAAASADAGDKLREQVEAVREAARARDAVALRKLLLKGDGEPYKPKGAKGKWPDAESLARVREQVTAVANVLAPVADILDAPVDEALERRIAPVARDMARVFEAVCEAYEDECGGALDFLALELRALDLLRGSAEVRGLVAKGARYLLVDEYQDTNPTQGELFDLLTGEVDTPGRFFAVGDAKQSIYAFRGSDVRVFNHASEWVPARNRKSGMAGKPQNLPWGLTCQDTPERRGGIVKLEHNYRTVEPLLKAGNELFGNLFAREEYRDFDARAQDMLCGSDGRPGAAPPLEFHLLPEAPRGGGTAEADADQRRTDDEAEHVAQQVKRLREEGVSLSDIAVLVRRGSISRRFRSAFARHNLPLLVIGEGGLFAVQEALDCVNLLRLLANPHDDVAALGVLRSPFAGLDDRFLTGLSLGSDGSLPLLERLETYAEKPLEAVRFLEVFDRLRMRAGRDAPAMLLGDALSMTGYPLAVGSGPDAEQRLANLARVVALVREMQQEQPSLAPLVRELRERIERGEDETQGVPDKSADGVRLMTIHKSKGLEFPVVILPDLGADARGREFGLVRHLPTGEGEPLGFSLTSLDDEDRGNSRTDFAGWLAKREAKERTAAEEKRVMYVAWTRAEKRLLLVGTVRPDKPFDRDLWAHQLLRAVGVHGWGEGPDWIRWLDGVKRADPRPHAPAIDVLDKALGSGELPLPDAIDTSLIAPVGEPIEPHRPSDPAAAEFGSLVHFVLERRLRAGGFEAGTLDARTLLHVERAIEALATLARAKRELPEFGIVAPDGTGRVDLLRDLGDGRFEIVDYKTDAVGEDLARHANEHHGEQLRRYAEMLEQKLKQRGRGVSDIRLLVCFTAPDGLNASQRLVEVSRP